MRTFAFIGTVFAFVFMANLAYAKTIEIEMLNKDGAVDVRWFTLKNLFMLMLAILLNGCQHPKGIT